MKGIKFIYAFIGTLVGLMFTGPLIELAVDAAAGSTGIAHTIHLLLPAFYALTCLSMMAGSMYKFFKTYRPGSPAIAFVGIFITALIGLMFITPVQVYSSNAANLSTAAGDTLGALIYGFLPAFYALMCMGIFVGAIGGFFMTKRGYKPFRRFRRRRY